MKILSKSKIIGKKSVKSVMNERAILEKVRSQFIVNIILAFQDKENLYIVTDFISGGDLRFNIHSKKLFTEIETRFIIASILTGLEFLHQNNIIHRDIKPENIVLDEFGYARITDFGIAREYHSDNHNETSGTPSYTAPEVLLRQSHGFAVDFYAVGVILYEMIMNKRPYKSKERKEIRDEILEKQIMITEFEVPPGWTEDAIDLTNKLLQRSPELRIGSTGAKEVMSHPWFISINWNKLKEK